ncbi:hypothetical protein WN943_019826 [Citrus x changshan-huyou]
MHKDPLFWRDNITNFEENDFQILRVLLTILDTSSDPRALAVACFDLLQFIQYHPAGRVIVTDRAGKTGHRAYTNLARLGTIRGYLDLRRRAKGKKIPEWKLSYSDRTIESEHPPLRSLTVDHGEPPVQIRASPYKIPKLNDSDANLSSII